MKKLLHFSFLFFFFSLSYSQTKEEITSALNDFSKKIIYQNPNSFEQVIYAELAYLKRTNDLPNLILDDSAYIKKQNDYYYKRFFPFSKLLNENAVVTEDCMQDEVNGPLNKANKLLFYVLYPNSIKMPSNIIDMLEEYSTVDQFFGPYTMLEDIYFLKKYNYDNLSKTQKDKLAGVELFLSKLMYTQYVLDKPWAFKKFLAVKVLKMNKSDYAKDVYMDDLVKYFNANGPIELGEYDQKDTETLQKVGAKKMIQFEIPAVLWIFLDELKKK